MPPADIAIVGIACRFAGDAKSPEAFHEMLVRGKDAWTETPSSRYNVKAFHHRSRERSGSMVCRGGYYLEQNLSKWDAPFFACSASEARAFDPQQRLLLEVAYESLENAGIPIDAIANTDAACFVGGFTNDYKKIVSRDLHIMPQYAMTGCSSSMLSNRVSWFFNLRGPSVTTDTACSSSITALHLACETIRSDSNKTRSALVGGTNLILDPDDPCALNALGFLSPDSRCFAFDSRANGYARGEGIAMIVLKHIDDAIRDGDRIRAVIRATGLNSDGRTAGISLPSSSAQQRLILDTYELAGLDPADTQYVELHGTGTKAGDPAEVGAVSRTIATKRSTPLYCGSVKTQIGHTEGAAGIAAVIKCVLAMENSVIPPNLNLSKPNPRLRLGTSNIVIPTSHVEWPECAIRRCSINNFGFGGTNGHVILDDARNYLKRQKNAFLTNGISNPGTIQKTETITNGKSIHSQARLFILSAPEQDAIMRQRVAHSDYAEARCTSDTLAYLANTLSGRRSIFQWRHAVVASSVDELVAHWRDDKLKPVKASTSPNITFVFTGQGAQWHAMGRELVVFDVFARSIRESASYLMAGLGCQWDAWRELMEPESETKVNRAEYSQPLCLVLQVALVDLLEHWGVKPSAVVGHSSGEIAAAYAARALTRESCLRIAYHRGLVSEISKQRNPNGSMMAVGLSTENVQPYLAQTGGSIVVACVNSPDNVTLAGDKADLVHLQQAFHQENVFCRLLQVENAYHSPQMRSVSEEYRSSINDIAPMSDSSIAFYSTVYGRQISTMQLTAEYWVDNMCSKVELVSALDDMIYTDPKERQMKSKAKLPSLFVEVGPHAALSGPIKQFKVARPGLENLTYHSLLLRKQDATLTAINTVGSLWMKGVPVNLNRVNQIEEISQSATLLVDLPSYSWNHSTSYWHETRQSRNHRCPLFPRHDLIGSLIETYNPLEPVWKNHLRVSELPWLQDHRIHGDVVFPAAGMICAVVEASRQFVVLENSSRDVSGFELRELSISQPLLIPNNDMGAETYLHLKPKKLGMGSGVGPWLEFSFYSCQENDVFVEHASGLVQIQHLKKTAEVDGGKELEEETKAYQERWRSTSETCKQKITNRSHYEFCESQGLSFGKTFQGLSKVRQNGLTVAFETKIPDSRACMPGFCESSYLIHPATLDAVLQVMMIAIPRMDGIQKQVWVPTSADSIQISSCISRDYGSFLHGVCESSHSAVREMTGSFLVGDGIFDTFPGLIMDGFKFKGLGPTQNSSELPVETSAKLYSSTTWKPDLDLLDGPDLRRLACSQSQSRSMTKFCSMAYDIVNEMCRQAVTKLDLNSNALPPHLQKYIGWMRRRCKVSVNGTGTPSLCLETVCHDICEDEDCEIENLRDFIEKYPVDGKLLRHVFRSLGAIFAQKTIPIAALMAEENFAKFYKEAYGLSTNIQILRRWFDLKAHKKPSLRIIEIGAGTASTSLPVLQQLADDESGTPRFSKYTFTDISPGWFENAKTVLRSWKSRVEYKVLDIENDPIEQGFDVESYDVVLAVNVLHATKCIDKTLENCRRLLKPGGNLVLGEYTNLDDLTHFIFGILPGWWAAEDGRQSTPLLLESQWDKALKNAGFSGADITLSDNDDSIVHRMSTLVSTKLHEQKSALAKDIIIVVPVDCSYFTKSLSSCICREFEAIGARAVVKDISTAVIEASGKTIVSLLDYENSFLEDIQESRFDQVKQLLLYSKEMLWITRSDPADAPGHPTKRIVSGLLRCLKTEDASRRLYELHFCHELSIELNVTSAVITRRLCRIWDDSTDELEEMETEEQNGVFCIPRYMPDKAMNQSLAREAELDVSPQINDLLQADRPLKLTIGQPGMLDTLHFVDDDDPSQRLLDEEVEIDVQACALNFLDIMIAMGQIQRPVFGHEASGIIRRVGSRVTKFSPGDRVIYIGQGAMRTCIRSHESAVHALPTSVSLENGVSIPIAYTTAYRSLVEVARLQKGESVLIHAAAGGLGQALIQIARMLEADIFCTVGTETKKQAIIALGIMPDHIFSSRDLSFAKGIKRVTGGRGVDVVVNSLAGEALRQSWGCLAPYGRFIEVGKKDILGNSGLDMQPFLKNAVFAGVNLEDMLVNDPRRCSNLVSKVLKLFEDGAISFIKPIVVQDFTNLESVFREMQRGTHIGKLVLRVTPESRVPVKPRKSVPLKLNPDALFMAEHGARHIAFISRSGSAREEAKDLLAKLAADGVDAKSYAGDVADRGQLREILLDISQNMPPIRGVIQGAMVLSDSLFHKMSHDQWITATRPKIQGKYILSENKRMNTNFITGSWNLHELLPDNLDFFIVLSSLAGIIGSVSQANYAAGNTFQDALVHYRQFKGLPAQSIDLGVMRGLGYVEEHNDIGARLSPFRLASVDEQQFFHLLRCALASTSDGQNTLSKQLLVGAGSGGIMQDAQKTTPDADFYWLRTLSQFSYLRQMDVKETDSSDTEDKDDENRLIHQLRTCKSMDEANDIAQDVLLVRISKVITVPVADINTSKPVYTYGVDSLVAVELRNWLSMQVKSDLSIFDLTSSAPISEVSKKIACRSQLVPTAVKAQDSV
ncbi:hypothetical protein BGW36DRAFT_428643 [Talaromyces proteolyticus]|uniref:Polyketide synthase n=1 Tax=Talaromyces proteolyticus TaxID=1131652 RepID=A0AAD4KQF7_9EURO|nr:uncharacterized protein BGW36DRAFT_428643 [Talaromyces proteolyticus]KAH8696648.1 hypothetical protein BGW36DRAFT_428643 [Talaromyces proteolyticus]